MSRWHLLAGGIALACLAACAETAAPPQPPSEPASQAETMQRMLASVNQVRAYVYGGNDRAAAQAAADSLLGWSSRMADLPPADAAQAAIVGVRQDRIQHAPAAMTRTAIALQEAVRGGDRVRIGKRLAQLETDGCGFCHRSH